MIKTSSKIIQMNSIIREVCLKYISHERYFEIKAMYEHPSRHYHNFDHVLHVAYKLANIELYPLEYDMMMVAAFLHDAVYDTHSKTNEIDSAELVDEFKIGDEQKKYIKNIILATTYQNKAVNKYEKMFMDADLDVFNQSYFYQLEFEKKIFKEYYWVSIPDYVSGRIKILEHLKAIYGCNTDFLVSYLKTKTWNIGFYPGTFYPFHIGHKSVLIQAEKLFDKIIVGFGDIESKTSFKWHNINYGKLNEWVYDNYETLNLNALITDNINELEKYSNVTIIRGLRNTTDLIYEQNYLQALKDLKNDVTVTYFMTNPEVAHVSSSLIRDLLKLSPKDAYKYYTKDTLCKTT